MDFCNRGFVRNADLPGAHVYGESTDGTAIRGLIRRGNQIKQNFRARWNSVGASIGTKEAKRIEFVRRLLAVDCLQRLDSKSVVIRKANAFDVRIAGLGCRHGVCSPLSCRVRVPGLVVQILDPMRFPFCDRRWPLEFNALMLALAVRATWLGIPIERGFTVLEKFNHADTAENSRELAVAGNTFSVRPSKPGDVGVN
jgi:hypothetical protein